MNLAEIVATSYTIDPLSDCWVWQRATNHQGYGVLWLGERYLMAHRVSYELHRGPIPEGLVTDHLCRNKPCINPAHLEPVTNRENVLRGVGITAQLARRNHCANGHPFTPENTYRRSDRGSGAERVTGPRSAAARLARGTGVPKPSVPRAFEAVVTSDNCPTEVRRLP